MRTKKKLTSMVELRPDVLKINGYSILLLPNKNSTISVKAFISNGYINETKETSGINHLLEHALYSAWKKCNREMCDQTFNKKGIVANATTNFTVMSYFGSSLNTNTDFIIDYITTITSNPFLYTKLLVEEKSPVMNELKILENKRITKLNDLIYKNMYKIEGMRYFNDTKIQIENLKKFNIKIMREIIDKFYTSFNIVYVISGDYNKRSVVELLKRKLPKKKKELRYNSSNDCFNKDCPSVLFHKDPEAKIGTIIYNFAVPLYFGSLEIHTITITLNSLRFLIHEHLRYKKQFTYNFKINKTTNKCGTLISMITHSNCSNIKEIYDIIDSFIKKYSTNKIPKRIIESQKSVYLMKYFNKYNNPDTLATFYGMQYVNQIHKTKPKLFSYKQVKDSIMALDETLVMKQMRDIFNNNPGVKAYQCSKEIKM